MVHLSYLVLALGLLSFATAAEEDASRSKKAPTRSTSSSSSSSASTNDLNGPEKFFDVDFFLKVTKGIVIHVFEKSNGSHPVDSIVLDKGASSVKGSHINTNRTEFSINLDWKAQRFSGSRIKMEGVILKMTFLRKKKEFSLIKMQVDQMVLGNENMREVEIKESLNNITIKVKTNFGYKVFAPLGTAFDCDGGGMFLAAPAKGGGDDNKKYRIGLSFPGMMLQVFDLKEPKFGPAWSCGEVFSIALWVGLIVSFFFALVCWWGFSMLASINTMDRFEDPKGKSIQVPQGE